MKIMLFLTSMVISLVILEFVCRIAFQPRTTPFLPKENDSNYLMIQTPYGIRHRKNAKVIIEKEYLSKRSITIQTNQYGCRGQLITPKLSDEFRVLFLGDSIIFGLGVEDDETIPYYLEEKLNQLSKNKVTVVNAGIAGTNLSNMVRLYDEIYEQINPDLVLIGSYLNDSASIPYLKPLTGIFSRSRLVTKLYEAYHYSKIQAFVQAEKQGAKAYDIEHNQAVLDVPEIYATSTTVEEKFHKMRTAFQFDWGAAWLGESWEKMKPNYQRLKASTQESEIKLVVMLFPVALQMWEGLDEQEAQHKFSALMQKLNIAHIDLLPELEAQLGTDFRSYYLDHCHFNPRGNQVVANILVTHLQAVSNITPLAAPEP